MANATYTAAGLAEKIVPSTGPSKAEIIRMIRHYTGEALLMPIGAVNTGTGKKRLYPSDAPLRAAVLLQLNRFGIPIGILKRVFRLFDRYLQKEFNTIDLVEASKKLTKPCIFVSLPESDNDTRRFVVVGEISQFEGLSTRPLIAIRLSPLIERIGD